MSWNDNGQKVAAAVMSLMVSTAHAAVSGNDLHENCQHSEGDCFYYVVGVIETHQVLMVLASPTIDDYQKRRMFCPTNSVTYGQQVDIVKKFLRDNPERRHAEASVLVLRALSNAFPCPR